MSFNPSNYRDQGVHGDSQSGFPDHQPGVRPEGEEQGGWDVERKEKSVATYGSWDAGSQQALKTFMSPYGDYDMDDSSFFAHTRRLNIIGPSPNYTQLLRRRSSSTERLLINSGERSMTTAASSFQKTDRSHWQRSPSPRVPLVPEKRTSPTESYMQLSSLQSSLPLADPTTSRKLLVLDLNGTLLLRSAHSGRRGPPFPFSRVHHQPALRTIYPRPYLPSFCAYIFHPTTLQWLDTMVWSSAQPHSVNDMVDKCFGSYKEGLKAIWARDTLGLSSDEYYKKTQTTKDLAKPWAQIPSLIPNQSRSENHNSEVDADRGDNHPSVPQQHSALTTILMDDSPLKAILQPWNHLCVSEYDSKKRKLDVEIAERELERKWLAERELERTWLAERELERTWLAERELERTSPAERERERTTWPPERDPKHTWPPERELERTWLAEREMERTWLAEREHAKEHLEEQEEGTTRVGTATDVDMAALKSSEETTTAAEVEDKEAERKRKRKEKKLLKKEKVLLAKEQQLEVPGKEEGVEEEESYDELLLAVIGILDALKHEGNVAGWMRSGGLVVGDQDTTLDTPETEETPVTTTTIPNDPQTTVASILSLNPRSKRDSSTISVREGPSKRRRLVTHSSQDMELGSDSEMVVSPTTPTMTTTDKRRSLSMSSALSPFLHPSPPHSSSSSSSSPPLLLSAQVEQELTGVPLITTAENIEAVSSTTTRTSTNMNNINNPISTPIPNSQTQSPLLWYETPCVLSHWAKRGRKALAELGIDVIHGVVPPNQNGNGDTSTL